MQQGFPTIFICKPETNLGGKSPSIQKYKLKLRFEYEICNIHKSSGCVKHCEGTDCMHP